MKESIRRLGVRPPLGRAEASALMLPVCGPHAGEVPARTAAFEGE